MKGSSSTVTGKGNYLSRLKPDYERRRFRRYECSFMARVFFTIHGARGIREYIVEACDISELGIRFTSENAEDIPLHFYLYIGQYQHSVGCAVVAREDNVLRCEFLVEESSAMIEFLASVADPASTLAEIRHPVFGYPAEH